MHFTFSTTFTTSALILASAALSEGGIYPPGGAGVIRVSLAGESGFTGCLNAEGKLTVTDCTQVYGNGQGGVSSDNGWFILDEKSRITTTTKTWSVAWVGTHDVAGRDAKNLIGNIGVNDHVPHGGPVWYAAAILASGQPVEVSGVKSEGAQEISLTFVSTFEE